MPSWTEIMAHTGCEIPERNTEPPKKKKFNTSELRKLLKYDKSGRCTNAFQVLTESDMLKIAYETIKSNPGNMVKGSDPKTLDGLPIKWFEQTSAKLKDGSYHFNPARRVMIPKPNGKMRPLGISSPRDKIIQQAAKIVMEEVLEPKFSDYSHGFRPSRGCHSALRQIRNWKGVPWLLEGDIKGFFDNIDHSIVANLLKKHFVEDEILNLYWKLVEAGYMEWKNKKKSYIYPKVGVPQGGIISPLLSNLILHEFDKYMEKLIENKKMPTWKVPSPTQYTVQ